LTAPVFVLSAIREELFKRIGTMNTQRISEMSGKVINNTPEAVKDHPAITALLSLGVGFQLHR